jgi:NADH-quinone oxidoreductase subunit F
VSRTEQPASIPRGLEVFMSTIVADLSDLQNFLDSVSHRGRTMLLPALHHVKELYGWAPPEAQEAISRALRVPLADVHGVIEFYTMFYNEPMARRVVRVCEDPACSLAGAHAVSQAVSAQLGLQPGETAEGIAFEHVPCLGMCEFAPAALNGERPAGNLTPDDVPAFLDGSYPEPEALVYGAPLWLLGRVGQIDPASLDDYEAHGGYETLRRALQLEPEAIITEVEEAGIVGRGGAMFPTGRKWRFTRGTPVTPAERHVIANADESEPGTFKDRVLMENDPFSLVEAMTLAGYAIGAEHGWIFVRGEYPRAAARLQRAVDAARARGYLGQNALGKDGFNFDIEIRLGAGAYICGEETALFEAIEGNRGFPRIKPPFPTTHGLFAQPTAINNVETLVAALAAVRMGAAQWRSVGTADSPGTKWFCLSGHVARPGAYELPFGVTVRQLIEMAGGVPGGRAVEAVLMGGAAGTFIGPEQLDTPLTYEDARQAGFPIGSGVLMVFDETADLRVVLAELARFFAHESCGKCYPCQLGTQRQLELLVAASQNGGLPRADREALLDVGQAMTLTSLCGLGQTAASAVISAAARWPELLAD